MIPGRTVKLKSDYRVGRSPATPCLGPESTIPAGTVGMVIDNLDAYPMTIADRAALRATARHNASIGKPGVILMLETSESIGKPDKLRFVETADLEYLSPPRPSFKESES